jgi:hypothetical protein
MWERVGEIAIVFGLLWIWSGYYLRFADRAEKSDKPPPAEGQALKNGPKSED